MARWALPLVAIVLVAAAVADARVAPAANCADPVTYASPDAVMADPAQPQTGRLVTYKVELDPAYLQGGTLVFTVTDPSNQQRQLQPSSADGLSVTYTPTIPGTYTVEAAWQGKNCNSPEEFGDGFASLRQQVTGSPNVRMSASAVPGYVEQFDVAAAHVLPESCTFALVSRSRRLDARVPAGRANPSGVWVRYGPNPRCPRVFAFHAPLSLIRSLLGSRVKHGDVGRMKIGGHSVTAIGSDFLWRQAGVTYDVHARTKKAVTRRMIASFD